MQWKTVFFGMWMKKLKKKDILITNITALPP